MKKLKKIQLHMGEEYWKELNSDPQDTCSPERHSLLWFLLNHEFREVPELHMKRHILISMDLMSYSMIRSPGNSLNRKTFVNILWNSLEREILMEEHGD